MKRWLKCNYFVGHFKDELIVKATGRRITAGSVPKSAVDLTGLANQGSVEVEVVERRDGPWAIVPTSPETLIPICEADLTASVRSR